VLRITHSTDPLEFRWAGLELFGLEWPAWIWNFNWLEGSMASTQSLVSTPGVALEDPLAYLPRSTVKKYWKGEVIYSESQPLTNLYLVLSGSVMVSRSTNPEAEIVIDTYQPDEFFGESALLGSPSCSEQARAGQDSRVMLWTRDHVEQVISRQPRLALALIQVMVQRATGFVRRIESLCTENVQQRLVRLLLRLAHRTGTLDRTGWIRLKPMTHELISRHLGTTREVVSVTMNRLKRLGYLRYSRAAIIIDSRSLQTLVPNDK
jgi:CRP/FNR family transcriptional regulator